MRFRVGLSDLTATTLPSAGRDRHRAGRDGALGIAEEIEAEQRQNPQRAGEPRAGEPPDQRARAGQSPARSRCRRLRSPELFSHRWGIPMTLRVAIPRLRVPSGQVYNRVQSMTETLSIRLDPETRNCLDSLAERSKLSKSFARTAEQLSNTWKLKVASLCEIKAGLADLDKGPPQAMRGSKWLKSWGSCPTRASRRRSICALRRAIQYLVPFETIVPKAVTNSTSSCRVNSQIRRPSRCPGIGGPGGQ